MPEIIWEMPGPSSSFGAGAELSVLPGRTYALAFDYDRLDGVFEKCTLSFHQVEAFRCTHMHALTVDMIESAYDMLVDMGATPWFREVQAAVRKSVAGMGIDISGMRHLRICFDDGPCYEFICGSHAAEIGR